jgi:hypothetical protein
VASLSATRHRAEQGGPRTSPLACVVPNHVDDSVRAGGREGPNPVALAARRWATQAALSFVGMETLWLRAVASIRRSIDYLSAAAAYRSIERLAGTMERDRGGGGAASVASSSCPHMPISMTRACARASVPVDGASVQQADACQVTCIKQTPSVSCSLFQFLF